MAPKRVQLPAQRRFIQTMHVCTCCKCCNTFNRNEYSNLFPLPCERLKTPRYSPPSPLRSSLSISPSPTLFLCLYLAFDHCYQLNMQMMQWNNILSEFNAQRVLLAETTKRSKSCTNTFLEPHCIAKLQELQHNYYTQYVHTCVYAHPSSSRQPP